jgi:N6-adenosine-specific RNA methylase IME4
MIVLRRSPRLPPGPFGAIYVDSPWHTITRSDKGRDRCPDGPRLLKANGYPTMTFDELAALPVASWAARDCRLFMWTIDTHLPQAIELGRAWGFEYSTVAFVWAKKTKANNEKWHFGGGHVTRKGCELCLFFLRGRLGRQSRSVRQLVVAPIAGYCEKPVEVYGRIEELVDGPYLEMFARPPHRPGWSVWGNEVSPGCSQAVDLSLPFCPPGPPVT